MLTPCVRAAELTVPTALATQKGTIVRSQSFLPRLAPGEQLRRRPPTGLLLEIEIRERLPLGVRSLRAPPLEGGEKRRGSCREVPLCSQEAISSPQKRTPSRVRPWGCAKFVASLRLLVGWAAESGQCAGWIQCVIPRVSAAYLCRSENREVRSEQRRKGPQRT
jgi:hypothetical protein